MTWHRPPPGGAARPLVKAGTSESGVEPLVSLARAAEKIGYSTAMVRRWLSAGEVLGVRLSGKWKVRLSDIEHLRRQT